MRWHWTIAALVLLAGCTEPSDEAEAAPGRVGLDLDALPEDGAAEGIERLGFVATPLVDGLPTHPYNLALGTDVLVASVGAPAPGLAPPMQLAVFDVSVPEDPRLTAQVPLPGGGVEAVAITPDDRFAFLGTEFEGAVGIWTFDLLAPEPMPAQFTPIATEGPHNIRYAEFGGKEYILASISHVATPLQAAGMGQDPLPVVDLRVDIFEFDRQAPPYSPMPLISSYQAVDPAGDARGVRLVHDAVHQTHPITGQDLMYVAHWDAGVRIVDITDPSAPQEIGVFVDPSPTDFLIIHTVKPHPTLIDGRHITVATSQCAYAPKSECHLRVLDTTDPTNITQIATWQLPGGEHGASMTTEIFDLQNGTVIAPWGGAGVWALDITSPAPAILGYDRMEGFANAAALNGDVFYVADARAGIHVLRLAS